MRAQERQPLLAANWKMYHTSAEATAFMRDLPPLLADNGKQVVICPPATLLPLLAQSRNERLEIGTQNIHWQAEGAFTGEISAAQAVDAGATWCICGHSERRQYFAETAEQVAWKSAAALAAGLKPIVCVGESLEQRQSGRALQVLHDDIQASLAGVEPTPQLVVAYEPVWAIGTGQVATPQDAEEAIAHLRAAVAEIWGETAQQVRILYGGSVKPANISALMACPNIDGALVGGASLQAQSFAQIVNG